jgi:hypothetical protein
VPPSISPASDATSASAPKPMISSPPVYNWFTEGFDTPVLQDAELA